MPRTTSQPSASRRTSTSAYQRQNFPRACRHMSRRSVAASSAFPQPLPPGPSEVLTPASTATQPPSPEYLAPTAGLNLPRKRALQREYAFIFEPPSFLGPHGPSAAGFVGDVIGCSPLGPSSGLVAKAGMLASSWCRV